MASGISIADLGQPQSTSTEPRKKPSGGGIPVAALKQEPSTQAKRNVNGLSGPLGNTTPSSPKPVISAIKRGLSWIDEQLDSTDYGRAYKNAVLGAQQQMAGGLAHAQHAQGPLAPVEGLGGVAQMSLGALAYLFSPVTALVDQAAVQPVKTVTKEAADKLSTGVPLDRREAFFGTERDIEDLEEFGIQTAAGMAGGEGAVAKGKIAVKPAVPPEVKALKAKMLNSFDAMAAEDPTAAGALAEHVGQVSPNTAKYLKRRIQKFVDASEEELNKVGKDAAEIALKELEGDYGVIKGKFIEESGQYGMGVGEGVASPTKRPARSGPSGYSQSANERPEPPQIGLSVGEGKASPTRNPARSGPSGYSDLSTERPTFTGLSTGEGKASPGRGTRSGPSGYSTLGMTTEKVGATLRTAAKEAMEALDAAGLSVGEGKASPTRRPAKSGRSGYSDLGTVETARQPTARAENASGESSASLEAINRVSDEKAAGLNRYILHDDDRVTPLTGVDAVDQRAQPGDVIVQRSPRGSEQPFTVLDRGGLAQGIAQGRINRALGLGNLTLDSDVAYFDKGKAVTHDEVSSAFNICDFPEK